MVGFLGLLHPLATVNNMGIETSRVGGPIYGLLRRRLPNWADPMDKPTDWFYVEIVPSVGAQRGASCVINGLFHPVPLPSRFGNDLPASATIGLAEGTLVK